MLCSERILWILALIFQVLRNIQALPLVMSVKSLNQITGDKELTHPRIYTQGKDLLVVLRVAKEVFYVQLRPVLEGLSPNTTAFGRPWGKVITDDGGCRHYSGHLLSPADGRAAVSICRRDSSLSGVIMTGDGDTYIIRPHERQKRSTDTTDTYPHVIYRPNEPYKSFCGVDENEEEGDIFSVPKRIRRSNAEGQKVIETAVYVDYPLYKKFSADTSEADDETVNRLRDTVLAIVNEVQLIYNYKSLKTKFKIVVVKLEILSENMEAPDPVNGDIDQYLDNFCYWQSLKNPPVNSKEHWDHALMLTGLDLHKVTGNDQRNQKVLGLAWVNGMCRPQHSCTLNEGSSFEAAFVIAHEMGHSLGMLHDGRGNDCDPNAFLMSEKTGPGKITWSTCSNNYLDKFFQKGFGACLEDDNSPPLSVMNHEEDDRLPGERFPLTEQCKLSLGANFKPHIVPKQPFNDVCRELWCVSGLWASVAHPALEGSECSKGKRCIQGVCTEVSPTSEKSRLSTAKDFATDVKDAVSDFLDNLKNAFKIFTF